MSVGTRLPAKTRQRCKRLNANPPDAPSRSLRCIYVSYAYMASFREELIRYKLSADYLLYEENGPLSVGKTIWPQTSTVLAIPASIRPQNVFLSRKII